MLVLGIHKDERIILTTPAGEFSIMLVRGSTRVNIGIDAPRDWKITRSNYHGKEAAG